MNYFKLEIIGFTIAGCETSQAAGAHRIELCDNPYEGGTTPSYGFINAARKKLQIALFPIVRPRGGDFFYSADEFEMMKADVLLCKKSGCDGVVTGLLNRDATVDKKRCSELVNLAYPMSVTFHRAFDRVQNRGQALEDIIDAGFERILSSGGMPYAEGGAANISSLIKQAAGRIIIMPGSGVRSDNIGMIAKETGASEFHSSARVMIKTEMEYLNGNLNEHLETVAADGAEIKKMIDILSRL
jgi:copper homeostasis protein